MTRTDGGGERSLCGEIGWLRTPTLPAGRTIPRPDRSLALRSNRCGNGSTHGVRLRTSFIVPHIRTVSHLVGGGNLSTLCRCLQEPCVGEAPAPSLTESRRRRNERGSERDEAAAQMPARVVPSEPSDVARNTPQKRYGGHRRRRPQTSQNSHGRDQE